MEDDQGKYPTVSDPNQVTLALGSGLFAVRADGTALRELNLAGGSPTLLNDGDLDSDGDVSDGQQPESDPSNGALPFC